MNKHMEKLIHDFAVQMYQEGYEEGRDEAWEYARKIGNNSWTGLTYQMGFKNLNSNINASWDCIMKYSASEAIAKIKEYEEKQKPIAYKCPYDDGEPHAQCVVCEAETWQKCMKKEQEEINDSD